jgi:hypothetical protein
MNGIALLSVLCVIFGKRMTWRLHIEMTEAKTFRIYKKKQAP